MKRERKKNIFILYNAECFAFKKTMLSNEATSNYSKNENIKVATKTSPSYADSFPCFVLCPFSMFVLILLVIVVECLHLSHLIQCYLIRGYLIRCYLIRYFRPLPYIFLVVWVRGKMKYATSSNCFIETKNTQGKTQNKISDFGQGRIIGEKHLQIFCSRYLALKCSSMKNEENFLEKASAQAVSQTWLTIGRLWVRIPKSQLYICCPPPLKNR